MEAAEGREGKELLLVGAHQSNRRGSSNMLPLLHVCRCSQSMAYSRYLGVHTLVSASYRKPQGKRTLTAPKGAPLLPQLTAFSHETENWGSSGTALYVASSLLWQWWCMSGQQVGQLRVYLFQSSDWTLCCLPARAVKSRCTQRLQWLSMNALLHLKSSLHFPASDERKGVTKVSSNN